MSAKEDAKLPELPEKFPHIFTEVVFQLIPEVNYNDLVYLSQLVKSRRQQSIYRPLIDALRKIQWTKLAGLEAIAFEKDIEKYVGQEQEAIIPFRPLGQVQHAKAIFEFIVNIKSVLDAMAVFLTGLLSISAQGGARDFKRRKFCEQVIQRDAVIGQHVMSLEHWFSDVQARRDKWIHRTSTTIFIALPLGEIGLLPIPKKVTEDSEVVADVPPTKDHYWTTPEFIELHFNKLVSLFSLIVTRCIEIELPKTGEPPPYPQEAQYPIMAFPFRVIKDMKTKGIRVRW